jgi:hypothetical protein
VPGAGYLEKWKQVNEKTKSSAPATAQVLLPPEKSPLLQPGNFVHISGPNPAMTVGEEGAWDDRALESGDCFKDKDTYYWYYHAFNREGLKECTYKIGVATAQKPLGPWKRHNGNPLLQASDNEWESRWVACPFVIKDGGKYFMFYSSSDMDWRSSTNLAIADSPLGPWERYTGNPTMNRETFTEFGYVGSVVKHDGKYLLHATNPDEMQGDYGRLYLATADVPEGPWTAHADPVLREGPAGSWDEGGFSEFGVLHFNGLFHAFYGSCMKKSDRTESIGYAYSADGVNWARYKENPAASIANVPNASAFAEVHAIIEFPKLYLYHTLRYFKCPDWYPPEWCGTDSAKVCLDVEDLGIQVLEITGYNMVENLNPQHSVRFGRDSYHGRREHQIGWIAGDPWDSKNFFH